MIALSVNSSLGITGLPCESLIGAISSVASVDAMIVNRSSLADAFPTHTLQIDYLNLRSESLSPTLKPRLIIM